MRRRRLCARSRRSRIAALVYPADRCPSPPKSLGALFWAHESVLVYQAAEKGIEQEQLNKVGGNRAFLCHGGGGVGECLLAGFLSRAVAPSGVRLPASTSGGHGARRPRRAFERPDQRRSSKYPSAGRHHCSGRWEPALEGSKSLRNPEMGCWAVIPAATPILLGGH